MRRDTAKGVGSEDKKEDGEESEEDCGERRSVVRNMEDIGTSLLSPGKPGDEGAEDKEDGRGEEAAGAQPRFTAAIRKEQIGELDGDKNDPHALVTEHVKEVEPVHAPGASKGLCGG